MKYLLIPCVVLVGLTLLVQHSSAESGSKQTVYSISVVSSTDPTEKVEFTGAYVAYDPSNHPAIQHITDMTPFEVQLTGENCLVMLQATSADHRVKVTLTKRVNGVLAGHADGTSNLNFLHGSPEGIGYGVPMWNWNLAREFGRSK